MNLEGRNVLLGTFSAELPVCYSCTEANSSDVRPTTKGTFSSPPFLEDSLYFLLQGLFLLHLPVKTRSNHLIWLAPSFWSYSFRFHPPSWLLSVSGETLFLSVCALWLWHGVATWSEMYEPNKSLPVITNFDWFSTTPTWHKDLEVEACSWGQLDMICPVLPQWWHALFLKLVKLEWFGALLLIWQWAHVPVWNVFFLPTFFGFPSCLFQNGAHSFQGPFCSALSALWAA